MSLKVEDRFRITIIPLNDSAPVATFTSLQVDQGETGTITPTELRGEDADTEDRLLVFDITRPPRHGQILLRRDDKQETVARSFTMQDIWRNRVIYDHDGGPSTRDSFDFILTDNTHSFFFVNENGENNMHFLSSE